MNTIESSGGPTASVAVGPDEDGGVPRESRVTAVSAALPSGDRTLRVAIVGAGKMAGHHARAIQSLGGRAHIGAVADPIPAARDELLQVCDGAVGYDDLDALLTSEEIDVVHVCSPPSTHAATARAAIEAGCHVYVEKPFAETRSEAERLLELADSRGLKVCAGHQLLFEAPARRAAELLPTLSRIVHVESYFSFRPVRQGRNGQPALGAELQLLDVLPHPTYLLLAFLRRAAPGDRTEVRSVEVGRGGTVHALVGRGDLTGTLVVTLEGRPVESYLRLVGRNGLLHADFVRGTVQRLIGPGSSGIDKALNPFRLARQLGIDTVGALGRRVASRKRSYPGLAEIFGEFYAAIAADAPSPVVAEDIVETVDICERIASQIPTSSQHPVVEDTPAHGPSVAVTGGTGFLGKALVSALRDDGVSVRVLARREPPPWERLQGVEYRVADLAAGLDRQALAGTDLLIHCAAETAGGWTEHQRNSLDATEEVIRTAAQAGVKKVIHVSSLAVVAATGRQAISESTPLVADPRSRGPYVWGKVESERLAGDLGRELDIAVKVLRPGALVDYGEFAPPGRLGRRLGNVFVAVGSPRDRLGVTTLDLCADVLVWMTRHFDDAPELVNLLNPELPSKRELVDRLKDRNPDMKVVWLPRFALTPLSWLGIGLQKTLRPGRPAINAARVFAPESYDTSAAAALARRAGVDGSAADA